MQKKLLYGISALALGAALAASTPSFAQHWGGHDGGGGSPHASGGVSHGAGPSSAGPSFRGGARFGAPVPARAFAGRSVSHFSAANLHTWSGGHWWHGNHHGRSGWWWFAGGGWFFYPYAVYPYPTYVSPDAYYDDEYYGPGDGYNGGGAGGSWYYCENPQGYYPYVQSCNGPWRAVAPTPPNMQQGDSGYDQGGPGDGNDGGPPNGAADNGPPDNGPPNDGGPDNGPPPPPPPGH
ncbi:MAG TPA: hypothetical protein VN932_09820 [Rhizomicrobium sp.]|nr:hypothetical protein [Rhizomicrobium sp.]